MNNNWAAFSKVMAWVLLILCVLGGIIVAFLVKGSAGIYVFIGGVVGGVISFCHFGTLSYLAEKASEKTEDAGRAKARPDSVPVMDGTGSASGTSADPERSAAAKNETVIDATSFANLGRNNYNVKVILDGNILGVVPSGNGKRFRMNPLHGKHVLRLEKEDDSNVFASKEIEISGVRSIRIGFSGRTDRIAIDYFKTY